MDSTGMVKFGADRQIPGDMQAEGPSASIEERVTFCRICEPFCGLIATVEDDKLIALRPDPKHPTSKGFACAKGIAYTEVQNDPDRVLYPLRRCPDGTFERVSWELAMSDIIERARRVVKKHGGAGLAGYMGNPAGLNYSQPIWSLAFLNSVGTPHIYSAGSQDTHSRFVASDLLYGYFMAVPIPDLDHTDLLVVLGANPIVSHGSLLSAPRIKDSLNRITDRGGRVLVVDPRRTETAREFDWLPIVPDSDAWFLLSLVHVLFADGLVDEQALAAAARGHKALRDIAVPFSPEATAEHTGIPADELRALAHELAAKRAVVYGRTGTCLGSSATLVNFLMDAVNLVAGNFDTRGGSVFGQSPFPLLDAGLSRSNVAKVGYRRSRIGGLPQVGSQEPTAIMAAEITTPGDGQIRALFVSAGNPVLSSPNGHALEEAFGELDLMVSLDIYINETNRHADYILPATAMYEREDLPLPSLGLFLKPFIQATDAVVAPAGEARPEWEVFDELGRGLGTGIAPSVGARMLMRAGERLGIKLTPRRILDVLIRTGRGGDRFGLRRGGLNLKRLIEDHPHGVVFAEDVEVGRLRKVVRHRDRKVHLDHPEIHSEIARLRERRNDPAFPLRLIGMREPRSENSWMHNAKSLRAARAPHAARMHPDDAARLGLVHTGQVRLISRSGAIELPVVLTEDIRPGVVAVPHGWGHQRTGGWQTANHEGGVNVNLLASSRPEDLEQLAGMSHLSGIPIRAEMIAETTSGVFSTGAAVADGEA